MSLQEVFWALLTIGNYRVQVVKVGNRGKCDFYLLEFARLKVL